MSENATNHDPGSSQDGDEEVSLLDLVIVLAKHKKLILGFPFSVAVVVALGSLLLSNIYTGTAKILPPQQGQSNATAILGQLSNQLGSLGGLGSLAAGGLGLKNPSDLYIGMLKSRPVADNLIQRFKLKEVYDQKYMVEARQALDSNSQIFSGKEGIITIEFSDKDPKRAAEIANAYVDELHKLTQTLAVTEASQRRLFFEQQLDAARKNMTKAEIAAREGLEKGLVVVDAQGRAMVETTARLRGQISVKEIQINAMRAFATDRNADLQQAQHELDAMKGELAKFEGMTGSANASGKDTSPGMKNYRLLGDLKYAELVFEMLARQLEYAKLDEARDPSIVQVLELAVQPEKKSRPKRLIITIVSALVAGLIAIIWAFCKEASERVRRDPQQVERLNLLRRYLWGK